MKKSLIALLALGGLAMAEEPITLTLASPAANDQAGYTSFDFVLSSDWLTQSPESPTLTDYVNLTSIMVAPAATWYNQKVEHRNQGAGVAIYEKSTTENVWNFVGSSDWQKGYTANGSTPLTFNVDKLTLSTDKKYTAVFYGNEESFNNLTSGSSLTTLAGAGSTPSVNDPVVAFGMRSVNPLHEDFTMYGNTAVPQNRSPYVTFTVQNSNVPEPTTGTLSLLALAGLCARRRKK